MSRTTFRDADLLILTQAEINARFAPFASTEVIINTTTKQVKKGPGRWADCAMVMDLSGAIGDVWIAPLSNGGNGAADPQIQGITAYFR